MENTVKDRAYYEVSYGISGVNEDFYMLIDKLHEHSKWKYPNRVWTIDIYYSIAFAWLGKEEELKSRVLKLESEMQAN